MPYGSRSFSPIFPPPKSVLWYNSAAMRVDKRTILIAGMGTSPAVLTETVWALCHQKNPMVPDEIVVLVTKSGKERLCDELLSGEKSVWGQMLAALKKDKIKIDGKLIFGDTSIRVIPDERGNGIADLRSGDDNLRAADFMLQQVRQYTESPDTVVLASIAGGRKTMSALLFSCMSLLGREDDKVFHVLLPPEFEGGVEPPMYYPVKGVTYVNRRTKAKYKSDKYKSELFEVPFVRMRGWYQEKFKTIPPTYRTLIEKVQDAAPKAVVYPKIEIDAANGTVKMNGVHVALSKTNFAALYLIANGCPMKDLHAKLVELHNGHSDSRCDWLDTFREGSRFANIDDIDDLRKTLSELRKKLQSAGFVNAETLVPQRGNPVTFPMVKVSCRNMEQKDVCGYPK